MISQCAPECVDSESGKEHVGMCLDNNMKMLWLCWCARERSLFPIAGHLVPGVVVFAHRVINAGNVHLCGRHVV